MTSKKTTYITTPIYYVNAQPHLGHAYTTIVADTYSRFRCLCGDQVRFQTGTDEHGDKIAEAADKAGVTPKAYADEISGLFRATWPTLNIAPDHFVRTTDAGHIKVVQTILQQVYESGDIYFDRYTGLYCTGCERFLTEKELVEGNCPDHQKPPEEITEANYFFRMSRYQQGLIDHINTHPEFITPTRYRNEVLSFLSEPLEDLCISRPTSRLTWGIPLPFDDKFVTYVWFDALINYLTGIGYPDGKDFDQYWSVAEHVIAKDILKPHAIYWPTMLMAMGLPLYQKLHVHGFWNVNDTKMSKSIGNVIRPADLVHDYGVDGFRYFVLREMSFGLDASYGAESIISRINSDLANDLGNLFSRSLAMVKKYCDQVVPEPAGSMESDTRLQETAGKMVREYRENMAVFQFHKGLQVVWELVRRANQYIVVNEPWALAKDPKDRERLQTVLYNLTECLRLLALVLRPVMPGTAEAMATVLGYDQSDPAVADLTTGGRWGCLQPGTQLAQTGPLFPRIERKKEKAEPGKKKTPTKKKGRRDQVKGSETIDFNQFTEVDLRVAEIIAAEPIKKSDRLLKLTVKAPEERVIVAGIAEYYQPQELIGRQVMIVANLKPVKLMGVESHGMVLAAASGTGKDKRLVLSALSDSVSPGAKVS